MAIEAVIQSDYRVRGYSVSDGKPAAAVSVNFDHPSGVYIGASAAGTIDAGEPEPVALQGSIGYAMRITPTLSIDGGMTRVQYFYGFGTTFDYDYTEYYLGVALPQVAARVSYSPNYYYDDTPTLYAELDGGIEPAPDWLISAHVGALTYLDTPPFRLPKRRYDWRVGVSRQFGRFGVHVDVSGRIQGDSGYLPPGVRASGSDDADVVLSLTRLF